MSRKENLLGNFKGTAQADTFRENTLNENIESQENTWKEQIETVRRGKPKSNIGKGRIAHQVTTVLYGDNKWYCKVRAAELKRQGIGHGTTSDYLNWLIDCEKRENPEAEEKAKVLMQVEADI